MLIPQDPNAEIGQIAGFSEKDIEKVIRMYENISLPENSTLYNISILFEATNLYATTTCDIDSSHATRSQLITIIIVTLNICTHLQ